MSVPASFSFGNTLGFPRKLRFRHRFLVNYPMAVTTATVGTFQISTNSIYDPQGSLLGGQAVYFDQLSALYNHYTCFRSHCKLTCVNLADEPAQIVLYVEDDTNVASSAAQAGEQPTATSVVLTGKNAQGRPAVLHKTWDAKMAFGGDVYDNDNLQGSGLASPTEQMFFTVVLAAMSDASGGLRPAEVNFLVEIIYDAVWDELRTAPLS